MIETVEFFLTGATLGLVAGITPGPLLTLVITETMKYNKKEGIKIALAPILSDLPIVALSLLILTKMSSYNNILGVISFLGSAFLIFMAYETLNAKPIQLDTNSNVTHSFKKGVMANVLSPHVYLFWILVGAPITIKAFKINILASVLFVLGFYIFITGSKIAIAVISEKTKNIFSNNTFVMLIRILGMLLIVFAIVLFKDGLKFFEII